MVYDAFRDGDFPTIYPSNKTPVTADVLEAGFIYATVILAFSLLIGLPGLHGKEIIFSAIKITLGVFITCSIMVCNFGQAWEVAHIDVTTQYKAGIQEEIHADVGVKIGLRSVNITLRTDPDVVQFNGGKLNETINYNERFSWANLGFTQGRGGFGPNAGRFNQEFRAAQWKGVPYPILWIAEYFTIDGEGIRWGRYYRQAGYYTHILMWLAFPCWILSMVMMHAVIRYGGCLAVFTGICLWIGNILFATIRNPNKLAIPFNHERILEFTWGWTFYLNLFTGILCTIIGLVIIVMDLFAYTKLASFFGVDVLQDYEEIYVDTEDIVVSAERSQKANGASAVDDDSDYEDTANVPVPPRVLKYRKRSAALTRKLQKTLNPRKPYITTDIELSGGRRKPSETFQEDVFEDEYQNQGVSVGGNSFQYRSGSGPMDNNMNDEDEEGKKHSVHFA